MKSNKYCIERYQCPLCLGEEFQELFSSSYLDDPIFSYLLNFYGSVYKEDFLKYLNFNYTLLKCVKCWLIFQKFVPNEFLLEKIYNEWLVDFDNKTKRSINYYKQITQEIFSIISTLKKQLDTTENIKMLDFGAGYGDWCLLARSLGVSVDAIELSEKKRNYIMKNGISVLNINEIKPGYYDFINTEQVF